MQKTYTYYCRLRPPAPGAIPKDTIKINYDNITINNREYWGSVTYNRPLTENEMYNYDLDYFEEV